VSALECLNTSAITVRERLTFFYITCVCSFCRYITMSPPYDARFSNGSHATPPQHSSYGLGSSDQSLGHGPSTSGRTPQVPALSHPRKFQLPLFRGTSSPAEFVAWEYHLVRAVEGYQISERQKIHLAVNTFDDHAYAWWYQLSRIGETSRIWPIGTWDDLRLLMRGQFLSSHYRHLLEDELASLRQGTLSVKEYFNALDDLLIMTRTLEADGMVLFASGLVEEIRHWVDSYEFTTLHSMYQYALTVEAHVALWQPNPVVHTPTFTHPMPSPSLHSFEAPLPLMPCELT